MGVLLKIPRERERERGEQSAVINSPGDIASFERVYIEVARERDGSIS